MHDDLLGFVATAVVFAAQSVGANERDDFVAHARGRWSGRQPFDALGAVAGFLEQLAMRGFDRLLVGAAGQVADQAGRQFDRRAVDRGAELFDQQELPGGRHRDDQHAAGRIGAFGEFPATAALEAQPFAVAKRLGFRHLARLPLRS